MTGIGIGGRIQRRLKRVMDVTVSGGALLTLSPMLLAIAAAVRLESGGGALFVQERIGKDGLPFEIFKFRTMVDGSEKGDVIVKEGDSRVTLVGSLLRKTSLDELPQLVNILKGDMSLIGPRPTLRYQVEQYDDFQRQRLLVKPGVTGWAQIHGRNSLPWPKRIELDVWYADNWSLWLDLRILLRTVPVVLGGSEVYGDRANFEMFDPPPD